MTKPQMQWKHHKPRCPVEETSVPPREKAKLERLKHISEWLREQIKKQCWSLADLKLLISAADGEIAVLKRQGAR